MGQIICLQRYFGDELIADEQQRWIRAFLKNGAHHWKGTRYGQWLKFAVNRYHSDWLEECESQIMGSGTPLVISTLNAPGILQQSQRGWYMTKWSLWVVRTRKESIIGKQKLRSMNFVLTFVPSVNTGWELAKSIDADIVSGLLSLQSFTHLTIQKKYFQKVSKRCSRRKIVFTYVWELWVATLILSYLKVLLFYASK